MTQKSPAPTPPIGVASVSSEESTLIDQGLAAYRAGEVKSALLIWEEALLEAPGDARIKALVEFARQQAASGGPVDFENDFDSEEGTNPELAHETLERVLKAERAAADVVHSERSRPRRQTIISPIPEMLATTTKEDWAAPQGWSDRTKLGIGDPAPVAPQPGAPKAPVENDQTEPVSENGRDSGQKQE